MSLLRNFDLRLDKIAELKDLDSLTDEQRQALTQRIARHSPFQVYSFALVPKVRILRVANQRWLARKQRKREGFSDVDALVIQLKVPTSRIKLLSVWPPTRFADDAADIVTKHEAKFASFLRAPFGAIAAVFRRVHTASYREPEGLLVSSYYNHEGALWHFTRRWVHHGQSLAMAVACSAPAKLRQDRWFLTCEISASSRRHMLLESRERIVLPQLGQASAVPIYAIERMPFSEQVIETVPRSPGIFALFAQDKLMTYGKTFDDQDLRTRLRDIFRAAARDPRLLHATHFSVEPTQDPEALLNRRNAEFRGTHGDIPPFAGLGS